jgi:hypothetical protein
MTQALPKRKPVTITDEHGTFVVTPGVIEAKGGDLLVFEYAGTRGATLFFPLPGIFAERVVEMAPGRPWRAEVQVGNVASRVRFAYAVYSRDADDFAVANSPPRMIIDPPSK